MAWIIHREVIEREERAQVYRGEREAGLGRVFWEGFKRGIRIWVLGLGGVLLVAAGIAQLTGA